MSLNSAIFIFFSLPYSTRDCIAAMPMTIFHVCLVCIWLNFLLFKFFALNIANSLHALTTKHTGKTHTVDTPATVDADSTTVHNSERFCGPFASVDKHRRTVFIDSVSFACTSFYYCLSISTFTCFKFLLFFVSMCILSFYFTPNSSFGILNLKTFNRTISNLAKITCEHDMLRTIK